VTVDVGDMVKAGQVLAEMDPVDLDQRVVSLDAAIARAASAAEQVKAAPGATRHNTSVNTMPSGR